MKKLLPLNVSARNFADSIETFFRAQKIDVKTTVSTSVERPPKHVQGIDMVHVRVAAKMSLGTFEAEIQGDLDVTAWAATINANWNKRSWDGFIQGRILQAFMERFFHNH